MRVYRCPQALSLTLVFLPFQTPEPSAHLPGHGDIEGQQLPSSPAEPEEQEWSQKTDHSDCETLSHQSESPSDTKTDPFESASDTESLPGDLLEGICLPPRGTSGDREAHKGCSDTPASGNPQEQYLTDVPGLDPKEELDLCLDFKEESHETGLRTFATVAGEVRAILQEDVAGPELELPPGRAALLTQDCARGLTGSYGLPPAKVVTVQDITGSSVFSSQKSRSESHLGTPLVWPLLLWCTEQSQSWPNIHNRQRGCQLSPRSPLNSTAPLGARAGKKCPPDPTSKTGLLCSQYSFDTTCWLPLGTSCLLHAKFYHSVPENSYDEGRALPRHCRWLTRTLNRAHSIAEFPLRNSEDPLGQNFVKFGTHLKEGTEAERAPITQTPLHPVPTQLSHLLPTSQRKTLPLKDQYKLRALNWKRASQDTPSEGLWLENQLGQDSRSCPVSSCLTAELVSLTTEEVPVPAKCKSGHGPESRPGEPQGPGQAPDAEDVSDAQKHLQDISAEPGNQTSNYTSKYILSEKRKPSARAKFPNHPSKSGSLVWNRDWGVCSRVIDNSYAPETTLKSSTADTLKKAEDVMVPDPSVTKNALQGFSGVAGATMSHCSCGDEECEQGHKGDTISFAEGLQTEPKADTSSRGTLIIIAVEQKGLQATRKKMGPLLRTQSCEFLEERPGSPHSAGATPCESPLAGKPKTCGNECELPAACSLRGNDGALRQVAQASESGIVLIPQAASEDWPPGRRKTSQEHAGDMLSTGVPMEENQPEASQSSRIPAAREEATRKPEACGPHPSGSRGPPSPEDTRRVCAAEGDADTDKQPGAQARARKSALQQPRPPHQLRQASREPGKRLAFPKVISFRKGKPLAAESPGGGHPGDSSGLKELCSDRQPPTGSAQSASGQAGTPCNAHASTLPVIGLQGLSQGAPGLMEVGRVDTPGDLGSRRQSSESCDAKRLKTPEKRLRARLASAHKTFASFFESRVLEKENTGQCSSCSLKDQKEKSRLRQSSWRTFLKSKDAQGSKRPSLVSLIPGPEILNTPSRFPPETNSHCEKQAEHKESYVFRDHWTPTHSPIPLSSGNLSSSDNRRKSEPTIKCTSTQESGEYIAPSTFPEKSWPMSPTSPGSQQAGISHTLPSSSTCCLAQGSQSVPSKPLSPKPQSLRPGAQGADFHYPEKGRAISVVSLGSYSHVDNSSEAPGNPKMSQAWISLLLSLQALDQGEQKEESGKRGQHPCGVSTAPSLKDLLGSEVSYL